MAWLQKVVSRFPSVSQMPADTVENVLHCSGADDLSGGDLNLLSQAMVDFWTVLQGGQDNKVGSYLSNGLYSAANAASVQIYQKEGFDPEDDFGSPVQVQNFTIPARVSAGDFPDEVAAVISYHGDLVDVPVQQVNPNPPPAFIRPQQRRRGRMYLGPFNTAASDSVLGYVFPSQQFREDVTLAFFAFSTDVASLGTTELVVYSPSSQAVFPMVAGWMDDAWDTQRRRGREATTRTTFG